MRCAAEITEYSDAHTYAVCNLASIAVNRFVKDGAVDHEALHAVAKLAARNLNRIIDINGYPTPETQRSNLSMRPIGIGVQGLADLLCMLHLPYESPEAIKLDGELMETIYHGALEASVELAEAGAGAYERFEGSPFSRGELQFDMWAAEGSLPNASLSGRWDWAGLKQRLREGGARNSLLTALMPTASTSQILGNAECFEPFHSNMFKRATLAGEFLVVNRHLMKDLMDRGLWTAALRQKLLANDGSVQGVPEVPEDLRAVYKTVWEVPLRSIIDHSIARGPFIDQSQSLNLFLASPSFKTLSSALIYGWRNGIKTGCYYLRSRPAVEALKAGLMSQQRARAAAPVGALAPGGSNAALFEPSASNAPPAVLTDAGAAAGEADGPVCRFGPGGPSCEACGA